jgi:hypothetical protein
VNSIPSTQTVHQSMRNLFDSRMSQKRNKTFQLSNSGCSEELGIVLTCFDSVYLKLAYATVPEC